ncbi:MAG: Stk1 family PASTA domain-containing Ser/Thr kinase [Acetatifactor sp.]|nr:Stk1 family PASTA domain-containing Ser/Thr kinase [Acetatifactor sp.]
MIKIGMMIGDRYEILEKIGTGGMSDVYKAKCHKLNRFVAVKVLKQEFSENENFVSKFRTEAQAAAGLAHPNIVNVYDVGEENGIYYIVMELVEGITLKKYIEKKARLSYKEAVSIAIQVSMGIEAAHNNHIIHRDIKPQNIIISKDGKVKVTDFGIAKAATSNTITSNVMGSVHYTSPEQARGGYSDEKSDIYSLGITMFEMLTGRVPFNGDTTVAIAIKHIQEEMPSPREFVPEIPIAVEQIVLKCCQKSPDRRYQKIPDVIADLKQSLMNPDDDFVVIHDVDTEAGTKMVSESELAEIKRQTGAISLKDYSQDTDEKLRLKQETMAPYETAEDGEEDFEGSMTPRMEQLTTVLAIVAGIVIFVIIVMLAIRLWSSLKQQDGESTAPPTLTEEPLATLSYEPMPNITGMTVEDAENALKKIGMKVQVDYVESDSVDSGIVLNTDVEEGTPLKQGTTVVLKVSVGITGVEVPNVADKTYETAERLLKNRGLTINRVDNYSDTVEEGMVISQSPESGVTVPKGTVVTVTVSKGREEQKIRVPNLIGQTEAEARFILVDNGLSIGSVSYVFNSEVEEGLVCYQSTSQGSYVDPDTIIDIKVSQGTEKYTYRCNVVIDAPTREEAPDYTSGTEVHLKLVTDDDRVLLDTNLSGFPYSPNYSGLSASGGTLTMTYTVTLPASTSTDPNTGESITIPGGTEKKSFTRRIDFVRE